MNLPSHVFFSFLPVYLFKQTNRKTAVAVAHVKQGKGLLRLNGSPIELEKTELLRTKALEPVLLLGKEKFANVDIRVRVKGGGHVSQMYAVRQAIAKGLVAYTQKYVDEATKKELKDALLQFDRTMLVADPRRMEPKKAVVVRERDSKSRTVNICARVYVYAYESK